MVIITKEAYKNNVVEEIIHDNGTLWQYEIHIQINSRLSILPFGTGRYDPKYRKRKFKLVDEPKKQSNVFM